MSVDLLKSTTDFMRLANQINPPEFATDYHDSLRTFRRDLPQGEINEYFAGERDGNLVETVDGLLDIIVVAWGTLISYIGEAKAQECASAVLRSNLAKVDGSLGPTIYSHTGKVLKPAGWTAPNIATVLKS